MPARRATRDFEILRALCCKSLVLQLRLLAKVKAYLPRKECESVIHAFIMSRLDYFNSLYVGFGSVISSTLQLVQNAASRLLTVTKSTEHITQT